MNTILLTSFFDNIPDNPVKSSIELAALPWEPLQALPKIIEDFFQKLIPQGSLEGQHYKNSAHGKLKEGSYSVNKTILLKDDFIDPDLKIFIGKGTLVEAGATIKNHTIIAENCEIRQGAYIRGYVYAGERSVIGHATEIKNSILIKHVEAGHFAYIGDSIIGSYVNLGAGTKISNLEFRTKKQKQQDRFPNMFFQIENQRTMINIQKFGAVIGDGCEVGCNAVLCPLVFLGKESWVMPCTTILKGVYAPKTFIKN